MDVLVGVGVVLVGVAGILEGVAGDLAGEGEAEGGGAMTTTVSSLTNKPCLSGHWK